jgi:hypothetical protein
MADLLLGQVLSFTDDPFAVGPEAARHDRHGAVLIENGKIAAVGPADALRAIDAQTFADLPNDIPPVETAPLPRIEEPALPETAFAKGADSPEAEAADQVMMEELRAADPAPADKTNDMDRQIAAARADFEDLGDFTLPDGTRAFDILDDLDSDQTLLDVLDACTIGANRP